jgi:hypothetical protein
MSLPLVIFIATTLGAGLGAAILLGEAKRFIVIAAIAGALLFVASSGVMALRAQLADQITRTIPAARR